MTDIMTSRRLARIPEYVLIQEMDRARRVIDDAQRIHDSLAAELGFERVRIDGIAQGDVIHLPNGEVDEVSVITNIVDPDGIASFYEVIACTGDAHTFDDGQMVSRLLDPDQEPF